MSGADVGAHDRSVRLLMWAAFASSASFRLCDAMLPVLARQFSNTPGHTAHVITAFTVAYACMQLVFGPLGERFNRIRIISIAAAGCAVGSVGAALAQNLEWLIGFRLLTGIAAGGIIPMSMAWIADQTALEHRQAILARFFSGQIFGMVFGQVLGGYCVDLGNWRLAFAVLCLLYLTIAAVFHWRFPVSAPAVGSERNGTGFRSALGTTLALLSRPMTRGVLWIFVLEAACVFPVIAFLPLYLHERFSLALSHASLLLVLYGGGGLLFSRYAARQGGRLNRTFIPVTAAGLIVMANGILLFSPFLTGALLAVTLSGFGYYMLHNTLLFQVTQRIPQARSQALALAISLFFAGQSAGIAGAGWLIDHEQFPLVLLIASCGLPWVGWLAGRRVQPIQA